MVPFNTSLPCFPHDFYSTGRSFVSEPVLPFEKTMFVKLQFEGNVGLLQTELYHRGQSSKTKHKEVRSGRYSYKDLVFGRKI